MPGGERIERLPARSGESLRGVAARFDGPGVATWLVAAGLTIYLALRNGGYDTIARSEIGIAVWWLVLLGTLVGAISLHRASRSGLALLGLLVAFAAWTGLSFAWTGSDERTATELARLATYAGVLALGLMASAAGRGRQLLNGVTTAVAAIAALAVLSRLQPAWFPANEIGAVLPGIEIERRLAYPLNYSSAVGALAAIALPLVLGATAWGRTIAGQALAAAAIPIVGLALYLATSGTGAAAAIVGLLLFVALVSDRLPKLATMLAGGAGAAILGAAVDQRDALARGIPTPAAQQQGDEVLAMAIVVCLGVALIQVGISLALRYGSRPPWLQIPRRRASVAAAIATFVAIPIAVAVGLPGEASERWQAFKGRDAGASVAGGESRAEEIFAASSSGRYQFWESAVEASETDPLKGIGAGTFEFWWAKEGSYAGFVRDAHSLYAETLGELGIVGFALIAALVLGALGVGCVRALRAPPAVRLPLAAATAAAGAFAAAAALDWIWELAALPVIFFLLVAVIAGGPATDGAGARSARGRARRGRSRSAQARHGLDISVLVPRLAVAALALVALYAIWKPLSAASALQDSRAAAAGGQLEAALASARDAVDAQPYAASGHLQEALILERQGELDAAAAAAGEATRQERVNWRPWLILSRIEAERGNAAEAVEAYRRARSLNPRSGSLAPPA